MKYKNEVRKMLRAVQVLKPDNKIHAIYRDEFGECAAILIDSENMTAQEKEILSRPGRTIHCEI